MIEIKQIAKPRNSGNGGAPPEAAAMEVSAK